jgi:hypothetical protein
VLDTGATVSDTLQIVVYDVFSVADTVSASDGGSFGGNVGVGGTLSVTGNVISPITLAGTTPTLTIGDAGAEDAKIVFDGNAQDFHIGLDDSADSLTIGLGSTLGTTSHMVIDANGHITKPLQSAFQVLTGTQNNIAGGTTISFPTERFDQNGDFASNTFTAPVTGKYQLSFTIRLVDVDSASNYHIIRLDTSNREYDPIFDTNEYSADIDYYSMQFSILADMDANDTASIVYIQSAGATQVDIGANDGYFSGVLVC